MTTETNKIEWVFDSEGVHVCSDCWDDEMRESWPRILYVEDELDIHCETCGRWTGDEAPDWMKEEAKDRIVDLARGHVLADEMDAALAKLDRLYAPYAPSEPAE